MNNKTERLTLSFTCDKKDRDIFDHVEKSGSIFGGSNEFPTMLPDYIEKAGDDENRLVKSFTACLTDGFETLTVELKIISEDWRSFHSLTVKSFRVISIGYNPSGYEIAEWDANQNKYDFTHEDDNKKTKAEITKEIKRLVHDYCRDMVESAKEKLYNALRPD